MAKQKKESGSQQWFLRTGVNAEFGPIEQNGLKLWAEQARILPGHEVSSDRVNWVSATSIDFLDMRWFIDDGDGDMKGPLNYLAAEALIKSGKFPGESRILAVDEVDVPEPDQVSHTEPEKVSVAVKEEVVEPVMEPDKMQIKAQELEARVRQLEKLLRQSKNEQRVLEERYVGSEDHHSLAEENTALHRELEGVKRRVENLQEAVREKELLIENLKTKVEDEKNRSAGYDQKIQDAVKARESALQQSRESERSFARLLNDANKRDGEYKAQIEALKKTSALSPEATSRFYSDQNAVFQILKRQVESTTKTMESEREHQNVLKEMGNKRLQELEKQRQILQNHMGNSPVEMTHRVLREQTVDPNAVRLRSELDNLRIAHERTCRRAEERERDLNYKLKLMHSDCNKLMDEILENKKEALTNQELTDQLAVSQYELAELRRNYEAERRQFLANNNAMCARMDEMENGVKGTTPDQAQSAEARGVKLASWMSFKK